MTGDVDEEVNGDNDEKENALDVLAAWWDRRCENAGSRALAKDERDVNCERFAITSAGTSGEVGCSDSKAHDYLGGDAGGSRLSRAPGATMQRGRAAPRQSRSNKQLQLQICHCNGLIFDYRLCRETRTLCPVGRTALSPWV